METDKQDRCSIDEILGLIDEMDDTDDGVEFDTLEDAVKLTHSNISIENTLACLGFPFIKHNGRCVVKDFENFYSVYYDDSGDGICIDEISSHDLCNVVYEVLCALNNWMEHYRG